jgi:hypothetical protein
MVPLTQRRGDGHALRAPVKNIEAMLAAGPPLLFGLRLWASVSLALCVAFWLQLDNPCWAGTGRRRGSVIWQAGAGEPLQNWK